MKESETYQLIIDKLSIYMTTKDFGVESTEYKEEFNQVRNYLENQREETQRFQLAFWND